MEAARRSLSSPSAPQAGDVAIGIPSRPPPAAPQEGDVAIGIPSRPSPAAPQEGDVASGTSVVSGDVQSLRQHRRSGGSLNLQTTTVPVDRPRRSTAGSWKDGPARRRTAPFRLFATRKRSIRLR